MLPKISLLDELRKGGYEASLITTFNAYLPFYEDVVLRRLVSAGVRHNVLLMDSRQYAHSVASYPPRLAGRQYTLMPMKVGGAFHPKLVVLTGKHKGLVFVGSHNMTLAGFGFNRELTNLIRIEGGDDAEGIALFRAVWSEIEYWLAEFDAGVPEHIKRMVHRVRDFAPWFRAEGEYHDEYDGEGVVRLLAGRPGSRPLFDQLTELVEGETSRICVGGAFFDQEMAFLKRVKDAFAPEQMAVAIDPATVELPPLARSVEGISFVSAETLGHEDVTEKEGHRYLHAKGILVEQRNADTVFASGSANPSAPAWFSNATNGNVELMLAYRGQRARAVAAEIGFSAIAEMPVLSEENWQTIAANETLILDTEPPQYRTSIAVVDETRIRLDRALLEGENDPVFVLLTPAGEEIDRTARLDIEEEAGIVTFAHESIAGAAALNIEVGGVLAFKLLLHHAQIIEEQARTGTQRRFKEALLSLETDTPNLELLIQCIDKIVFSEARGMPSAGLRRGRTQEGDLVSEQETPESLEIDVSVVGQRKGRRRLDHSGDFAYLLDALIYHLRMQDDKSIEERDRFGRNEEEQIGADDELDADDQERTQSQEALLDVCHARVATVVSRMAAQLKAYSKGEQPLPDVLIRLLGVLAVLRELRGCDGRVSWVEKGSTTVPLKDRMRLLEEVMCYLFEGQSSLLHLGATVDELAQSDDIARLKGLILWLAWDCGLTMDLQKPFMESSEALSARLRRNAMVLALAQMIRADEVVIDEARQSIGSLTSSELEWLSDVLRVAKRCEAALQDRTQLKPAETAQPGDIAVHRKVDDWDLRIVASSSARRTFLVSLDREQERLPFMAQHLGAVRLT